MGKARTLYDLLELSSLASPEAVEAAYKRLETKFRTNALTEGGIDQTTHFNVIKDAYKTLSSPEKRQKYDDRLEAIALKESASVYVEEPGNIWKWAFLLLLLAGLAFSYQFYVSFTTKTNALTADLAKKQAEIDDLTQRFDRRNSAQATIDNNEAELRKRIERQRELSYASSRVESELANDARQARQEADQQRMLDEMRRRRELAAIQAQVDRERRLADQMEYQNRYSPTKAAGIPMPK